MFWVKSSTGIAEAINLLSILLHKMTSTYIADFVCEDASGFGGRGLASVQAEIWQVWINTERPVPVTNLHSLDGKQVNKKYSVLMKTSITS